MPQYTGETNLYLPNRADDVAIDTTLSNNFQILDDKFGVALTDEDGVKHPTLYARLDKLVQKIGSKGRHFIATDDKDIDGDGVNDDTAGIQALLDAAATQVNGISIYFPAGIYKLTAPLIVLEGTNIMCHPNAHFLKSHDSTMLKNIEENSMVSGYDGAGLISISGGIWDANADNHSGGTAFVFGHGQNISIRGIELRDVDPGHAIEFNACKYVLVQGNKFRGMKLVAGKEYSEAVQLDIMKSDGVFPWKAATGVFDSTPCESFIICDNFFGASDTLGAWGRAVGTHSSTIGKQIRYIQVVNNIMQDMLEWAVRAYNWECFNISGNIIKGCGQGINVRAAITGVDTTDASGAQVGSEEVATATVANNVFYGGLTNGRAIEIYGEDGTNGVPRGVNVFGNNINNVTTANDNIYVAYCEDVSVTGNVIKGGSDGVAINDCKNVTVTGNNIKNSNVYGIQSYGGTEGLIISNNTLKSIRESAMYFTGISDVVCMGNQVNGWNGAGNSGNGTNAIRMTSGVDKASIMGNVIKGGGIATHAIYATNSCADVTYVGNVAPGYTIYNGVGQPADTHGNIGTMA